MGDGVEEIKSVDELRKAQAATQAQGGSITNYNQWQQILEDLQTAGIESTGNFEGDVKLHSQVMEKIEAYIQETQETQRQQQMKVENNEATKVNEKTSQDKEQVLKANVANATSSVIMADYMKYYHFL